MTHLNMLGKPCPIPVIEAKKALNSSAPGDTVEVLVDNDISRQNLEKMAKGLGHGFSFKNQTDSNILVKIEVTENSGKADDEGAGLVVAIGSDSMGGPNEELGRALMKSFIFSLTELDTPPEHLIFFNGGVLLATDGSNVLADLQTLAAKGTQIASCGLCLNFYQRTEQLAIGQITNMYAISLTMSRAKKLINI